MQQAVEFALAHRWPDDAVSELERLLSEKNMAAALTLVRAQDMPEPARQQLMALVKICSIFRPRSGSSIRPNMVANSVSTTQIMMRVTVL